jgi:hypothetical protein
MIAQPPEIRESPMTYLRRSVMTFQFKGRPRRGLFWEKSVYALWFDYAKVSPRNIPPEFGNLSAFRDFEEWWRHPDYGFELFCEPANEQAPLKIVRSIPESEEQHVIYLRVHVAEQPEKLKRMFDTVLKKQQEALPDEPTSRARFQPSMPQRHMKLGALKRYLENWKMREAGMSRRDIFAKRYRTGEATEDQLRVISRECQRANDVFRSIEKGTFP